jgi:hypothetical protein
MTSPETYELLIRECIVEMDKPLPEPCLKTKECRMAGGCPECLNEV